MDDELREVTQFAVVATSHTKLELEQEKLRK